jgi:hypothetical protein
MIQETDMKHVASRVLLADGIGNCFSWTSELRECMISHPSLDLDPFKKRSVITVSYFASGKFLTYFFFQSENSFLPGVRTEYVRV